MSVAASKARPESRATVSGLEAWRPETAWRHTTRLTEYVSAVRAHVEAMPPGQARTEAEAWIRWAAATAERLDPLRTPPRLPDIPEPRADDLRPFLGHRSPYGP